MKKKFALIILFALFGFSQPIFADDAPDLNDFLDDFDPNPTDAPIDTHIVILLSTGLLIGLYNLKCNSNIPKSI
uniref:hypothetical protein n=1 Tax=Flavobacterium sp. TaxID=239 RepID=UPI0040490C8E